VFVLFWQKNIGKKAARKMLVKMTGLNFINVLRAAFSYKRRFGSFFNVHVARKSCQNDVRTKSSRIKH